MRALLAVVVLAAVPPAAWGQVKSFADAADVAVEFVPAKARRGEPVTLRLTVAPKQKGWYTYPANTTQASRNVIKLPDGGPVAFLPGLTDPPGAVEKDPLAGEFDQVYKKAATWEVKAAVRPDAEPGAKTVTLAGTQLQVCKDRCLYLRDPSATLEVTADPPVAPPPEFVKLLDAPSVAPPPPPKPLTPPTPTPPPAPESAGVRKKAPVPPAEYAAALDAVAAKLDFPTESAGATAAGRGFGGLLAAAAFWGWVSLVTPCVFPMIPITVSLFLKQGHQSPREAVKYAAVYCLTIVAVIGASAVFLLGVFKSLSVDPYMNMFLGGLFVAFALSLFGMYDITLPGFLLRFTDKRRGSGGLLGTVFGALAFSIVGFTCVAPFLGGFAGLAAGGGYSRAELGLAGLTFAAAFASPFFVLALFPSLLKQLPRSGGWLDTVKVVMGFLELAAALKFFRTAEVRLTARPEYFTYDLVLAGWVAVAVAAGLYLLNAYRLPHDPDDRGRVGVPQLLVALGFLGLAAYLAPALVKGNGSNGRPAGVVYAWVDAFLLPGGESRLPWSADLPTAVAAARADGKRVFVDFTGVTCSNCQYNEQNVFVRPEVAALLRRYELVQLYTDDVPAEFYTAPPPDAARRAEGTANYRFQASAFKNEQLPLYAVLAPAADGRAKVVGVYDEGKINRPDAFAEFLERGLK